MNFGISSFFLANEAPRVYVTDEALSRDLYVELSNTFPAVEMKERMGNGFFSEIDSARHRADFDRVLKSRPEWKQLYRAVSRSKFKEELLHHFKQDLELIRGSKGLARVTPQNTEVKCSFHMSRRGYLLSPHTDTGKKMITIVIYFGDSSNEMVGAGTRFYQANDPVKGREFMVSLIDNDDRLELDRPYGVVGAGVGRVYKSQDRTPEVDSEIRRFDSLHKCTFESRFQGNRAVLFIKSNYSWHDVRLDTLPEGVMRQSFVINFSLSSSASPNPFRRFVRALNQRIGI